MTKLKVYNFICGIFKFIWILLFVTMFLFIVERESILSNGEAFISEIHLFLQPVLQNDSQMDTIVFSVMMVGAVAIIGSLVFDSLRKSEIKRLLNLIPVLKLNNKKLIKQTMKQKKKNEKQAIREQKLKEKLKLKEEKLKHQKEKITTITTVTETVIPIIPVIETNETVKSTKPKTTVKPEVKTDSLDSLLGKFKD